MRIRAFIALAVLAWVVVDATGLPREPVLHAQATARKTFVTESVKRSDAFINPYPTVGNGRFVWHAAPLILVVAYAHNASMPAIEGKIPVEPVYDIDATFPASATPRDVQDMLKALLADKFALRVHTASRTLPHLRLIPEAGGHKLKPAATRSSEWPGIRIWQGRFSGAGVTVPQIARALASSLKQPVLDATGIAGAFDVDVRDASSSSPSFPGFVAQQLGLKLEPATGKVEVLVVDGFKMR